MARGQTLEDILNLTRAEAKISLSPAMNTQVAESHKLLLQREQKRLWEDYAWPHMRVHKLIPLQSGQYLYDLPADNYDANAGTYTLAIDRVETIHVRDGGEWVPLIPEITEANYSVHETQLDERDWPVRNWQATDNDQIEVWPIPDTNGEASTLEGYLRVTGIRDLQPFIADADRADLDDSLLSLYVAADVTTDEGRAKPKLEQANKLYTKLKGKQTKTQSFQMFGTGVRRTTRLRGPKNYIGRYEQ